MIAAQHIAYCAGILGYVAALALILRFFAVADLPKPKPPSGRVDDQFGDGLHDGGVSK